MYLKIDALYRGYTRFSTGKNERPAPRAVRGPGEERRMRSDLADHAGEDFHARAGMLGGRGSFGIHV